MRGGRGSGGEMRSSLEAERSEVCGDGEEWRPVERRWTRRLKEKKG